MPFIFNSAEVEIVLAREALCKTSAGSEDSALNLGGSNGARVMLLGTFWGDVRVITTDNSITKLAFVNALH
jgi:hypothetical protein